MRKQDSLQDKLNAQESTIRTSTKGFKEKLGPETTVHNGATLHKTIIQYFTISTDKFFVARSSGIALKKICRSPFF